MENRAVFILLGTVAGLLCVSGDSEIPTAEQVLAKVSEVVKIPDLKNLNVSALPFDQAKNALKNKCDKNGGETAYERANNATYEAISCVRPLVNQTELQEEIAKAKPTGDLDLVFKKYCNKKGTFQQCITGYMDAIEPCLSPDERENRKYVQNITDSLLNFVCFKDGDRIALFIAAGGPECFQSKVQVIQDCVNSTASGSGFTIPTNPAEFASLATLQSIPDLIFDKKSCQGMNELQACIVKELENCQDPTPANLMDSIFNFVKKVTPCQKILAD